MNDQPTAAQVRPRNPYIGFAFSATWLLVAVFGIVVLLLDGERVVSGEVLIVVILGSESASPVGFSAMLMILTLLGMAGATLISVGLRGNAAFRRRRSR
ncbi:hypothetical protein [Homoserinimonas sp. A520]